MEQYIPKDALVAEIERIKEMYCYDTKTNASFVAEAVINSINNAINSIEVKELENSNDAFIEKACSWLENNLQGIVGGSVYIEDFRKYMEGVRYDNRWNHV